MAKTIKVCDNNLGDVHKKKQEEKKNLKNNALINLAYIYI